MVLDLVAQDRVDYLWGQVSKIIFSGIMNNIMTVEA